MLFEVSEKSISKTHGQKRVSMDFLTFDNGPAGARVKANHFIFKGNTYVTIAL